MSRQRTFWRDKFKIGGQTMAETDKKLKEITERLEQGVKEIFTSERYTEYLDTMSKFHNYSFQQYSSDYDAETGCDTGGRLSGMAEEI